MPLPSSLTIPVQAKRISHSSPVLDQSHGTFLNVDRNMQPLKRAEEKKGASFESQPLKSAEEKKGVSFESQPLKRAEEKKGASFESQLKGLIKIIYQKEK